MGPKTRPSFDTLMKKNIPGPTKTTSMSSNATTGLDAATTKLAEELKKIDLELAGLEAEVEALTAQLAEAEEADRKALYDQHVAKEYGAKAQAMGVQWLETAADYVAHLEGFDMNEVPRD